MLVFFFSLGLLCGVEFALAAQLSASTTSTNSYSDGAEADRITDLPGASSSLLSAQFSGYLEITETKALHYMYFESERDPTKDPVIFWTNGGPGTVHVYLTFLILCQLIALYGRMFWASCAVHGVWAVEGE